MTSTFITFFLFIICFVSFSECDSKEHKKKKWDPSEEHHGGTDDDMLIEPHTAPWNWLSTVLPPIPSEPIIVVKPFPPQPIIEPVPFPPQPIIEEAPFGVATIPPLPPLPSMNPWSPITLRPKPITELPPFPPRPITELPPFSTPTTDFPPLITTEWFKPTRKAVSISPYGKKGLLYWFYVNGDKRDFARAVQVYRDRNSTQEAQEARFAFLAMRMGYAQGVAFQQYQDGRKTHEVDMSSFRADLLKHLPEYLAKLQTIRTNKSISYDDQQAEIQNFYDSLGDSKLVKSVKFFNNL